MKRFFLVVLSVLMVGCSCEQKLMRARKNCPELFVPVVVSDTLVVPDIRVDTTFLLSPTETDTFVIARERLSVKLVRHRDTVFTELFVAGDTVIKTQVIEVPTKVVKCDSFSMFRLCGGILLTAILLFILYLLKCK